MLVLAGFYFSFASKNFAADKLRISYSAINATQAFLWVAQEKGIFTKHGLEGELLYINSGTWLPATRPGLRRDEPSDVACAAR